MSSPSSSQHSKVYMLQVVLTANGRGHQIGAFFDSEDSESNKIREAKCCRFGCEARVAFDPINGDIFGDGLEHNCMKKR